MCFCTTAVSFLHRVKERFLITSSSHSAGIWYKVYWSVTLSQFVRTIGSCPSRSPVIVLFLYSTPHTLSAPICSNRDCFFNFLFIGQTVCIFQIQQNIIEIRVIQCRGLFFPPQRFYNIDALSEYIISNCITEFRIALQYRQTVLYRILYGSV